SCAARAQVTGPGDGIRLSNASSVSQEFDLDRLEAIGKLEAENLRVERQLSLEGARDVGRVPKAVSFAGKWQVGVRTVSLAQRADHLLRLRPGHDHVVEALQDEQGTIYAFGEVNGRARPVTVEPLRIRRNEAVRVARLEFVRVTRQCLHVADAVVARTGGADVGERGRTPRRVTARAV